MKKHQYTVQVEWTGNKGEGTKNYKAYSRNHTVQARGKYDKIHASSDPSFLGDATKYNPEELFLAAIANCHMLWYLHLCASNNIIVIDYTDNPVAIMEESKDGSGKFTEATLYPTVTITDEKQIVKATHLHTEAHKMCFIANSCNFQIKHKPTINTL